MYDSFIYLRFFVFTYFDFLYIYVYMYFFWKIIDMWI